MADGDLPGSNQVNNANNQGQGAINSYDPTATANSLNNGFTQFGNQQLGSGPNNANDYMKLYSSTIANNPTVTSLYNTANDMFNVPALKSQATYLQNEVNNAAPNAYRTARGFDYSQPQVENEINTNLRFLQPEANAATANAQTAEGLAQGFVNSGVAQNNFNLMPVQAYGNTLNQVLAGQMTGWTQDAQNQFAGLQAKMQAGVGLSEQEMQTYQALTAAKEQYDAAISGQQEAYQQASLPYSEGTPINAGQYWYNPSSGKTQYFR